MHKKGFGESKGNGKTKMVFLNFKGCDKTVCDVNFVNVLKHGRCMVMSAGFCFSCEACDK